jgi:hypothetical protein
MNTFLNLAERQISARRKTQTGAAKKRAVKTDDRKHLSGLYARWRRERLEMLVAAHGEAACTLLSFLDRMTINQAAELIVLIEQGPWRYANADVRFEVLALVDAAIIRLREKQGLVPFDDPLVGEPANVFQIIRESLR